MLSVKITRWSRKRLIDLWARIESEESHRFLVRMIVKCHEKWKGGPLSLSSWGVIKVTCLNMTKRELRRVKQAAWSFIIKHLQQQSPSPSLAYQPPIFILPYLRTSSHIQTRQDGYPRRPVFEANVRERVQPGGPDGAIWTKYPKPVPTIRHATRRSRMYIVIFGIIWSFYSFGSSILSAKTIC